MCARLTPASMCVKPTQCKRNTFTWTWWCRPSCWPITLWIGSTSTKVWKPPLSVSSMGSRSRWSSGSSTWMVASGRLKCTAGTRPLSCSLRRIRQVNWSALPTIRFRRLWAKRFIWIYSSLRRLSSWTIKSTRRSGRLLYLTAMLKAIQWRTSIGSRTIREYTSPKSTDLKCLKTISIDYLFM